jgi:hypothetical protein
MTDRQKSAPRNVRTTAKQKSAQDLHLQSAYASNAPAVDCTAQERARLIALGDSCLRDGFIDLAQDAYIDAGAKDKLIAVGDQCMKEGEFELALEVYNVAESLP